jgi:hypothetical protein
MDERIYLPQIAWRTYVNDVTLTSANAEVYPSTYTLLVSAIDVNEPGAVLEEKEIGFWIKDFVGHTYRIVGINVDGNNQKIEIEDSLGCGQGPQTGQQAIIYKSVGNGTSPYLAPIYYRHLDESALEYSRQFELDILWNHPDETNDKWSLQGMVFSAETENVNSVLYTNGSITHHLWHVLSDYEVDNVIGRENYHPEKSWSITGSEIILANSLPYYVYIKIPLEDSITTAEVVFSSVHLHERYYEGFITVLAGSCNAPDPVRTFNMQYGNAVYRNHAKLENLYWTDSNHTGEVNKVAGFDIEGNPDFKIIPVPATVTRTTENSTTEGTHTHQLDLGVLDHGELSGLEDDDHPQYYNQARGDARYSLIHPHPYEPIIEKSATTNFPTYLTRKNGEWYWTANAGINLDAEWWNSRPEYPITSLTIIDGLVVGYGVSNEFITGTPWRDEGYLHSSLKGTANGLAELDENGLVKNTQLPSYVDDVLEYETFLTLPVTGEAGKIYVITGPEDTDHYNKVYRWSGSQYSVISDTLALGETYSTAFRGDFGKIAYDHTFLVNNPHAVTALQIGALSADDSRIAQWNLAYGWGNHASVGYELISNKENITVDTSSTKYPTVNLLKTYVEGKISDTVYGLTWDGITTIAPSKNAVYDKISSMERVSYNPVSLTVNTGVLAQGTVGDLTAIGGGDVRITELAGPNPLVFTFGFTGVKRASSFAFYGRYNGGSSDLLFIEAYNYTFSTWQLLGEVGATTTNQWRSFNIFQATNFISGENMLIRISHQQTGNNAHQFILDYVEVNYGGGGGGTYQTAAEISFTPTESIPETSVQSALEGLDLRKVDKIEGKGLSEADVTAAEKIAITHINRTALDNVSGVNTGDQDLTGLVHANRTALDAVSGTNTGDETTSTIKTKLGITTLSGSNTGDQDLSGFAPASGSANYIQVSPASAQGANINITGSGTFGGDVISSGDLWIKTGNTDIGRAYFGSSLSSYITYNGTNFYANKAFNAPTYKLSGNDLFGNLSANYLPVWDGGKLVNSPAYKEGNGITMGGQSGVSYGYRINAYDQAGLSFTSRSGIGAIMFNDEGNAGFGTMAPLSRIEIDGIPNNTTPQDLLTLARPQTVGNYYAHSASFALSSTSQDIAKLDIKLLSTPSSSIVAPNTTIMTLLANGNVSIPSTTPSTSPTTGALTVAGGLGVGGNVNANGNGYFVGTVIAAAGQGFQNASYLTDQNNPIWAFNNATSYGIGYYQHNTLGDDIRLYFGDKDNPKHKFKANGDVVHTGSNTASSFIKSGGTSSQFLKADGGVDATAYALASGSSNYIQNQNSSAQSANIWIDGSITSSSVAASGNAYFGGNNVNSFRFYTIYSGGNAGIDLYDANGNLSFMHNGNDGQTFTKGYFNAPGYKLNGNDLFGSLTSPYLTYWNGTAFQNSLLLNNPQGSTWGGVAIKSQNDENYLYAGQVSSVWGYIGHTYYNVSGNWRSNQTDSSSITFNSGVISFLSDSNIIPNSNFFPTSRMTILPNGMIGIGTEAPTRTLSFNGVSNTYIGLEDNTTSNTAGLPLTINAGGATVTAENKRGGDLILKGGQNRGVSAGGDIQFLTSRPSLVGTLINVTIINGGGGYQVGDVLTVSGGTGGTVTIAGVNTSIGNPITSITLTTAGSGYTHGTTVSLTGGSGGSATALLTTKNSTGGLFYNTFHISANDGFCGVGYTSSPITGDKFGVNGAANINGRLTATSFVKTGGTSAQYLLADGSVTTVAGSVYKGEMNGSTGVPIAGGSALVNGTGTTGWYYACSVAGTRNYGSGNITLAVGDQLYYSGTVWMRIPGAGSYTLPAASAISLGGVVIGSGITVTSEGVISVDEKYPTSLTISGNSLILGGTGFTSVDLQLFQSSGGAYGTTAYAARVDHTHSYATVNSYPTAMSFSGNSLLLSGVSMTTVSLGLFAGNTGSFGSAASAARSDHSHSAYVPYTGATANVNLGSSYTITANNFILSSDKNLKENIQFIKENNVDKIQLVEFNFKADITHNKRYGVIAQQVEEHMPELVKTDEKGEKSVAYIDLLIAKINQMEKRLKLLEDGYKRS